MDDEERQALRAEGFDPDDPAVVAAIDMVRWELSLLLGPTLEGHNRFTLRRRERRRRRLRRPVDPVQAEQQPAGAGAGAAPRVENAALTPLYCEPADVTANVPKPWWRLVCSIRPPQAGMPTLVRHLRARIRQQPLIRHRSYSHTTHA